MSNFLTSFVTPRAWQKGRSRAALNASSDALFDECYRGRTVILVQLIWEGADVNAMDYDQQFPLSIACGLGHFSVAKLLLENGAKVEAENGSGTTALFEACRGGYTDLVELLLSFGANPNQTNWTTGETILLSACVHKRWNVVQILLEHGVQNIEERTDRSETVLHLIAHSSNLENHDPNTRLVLKDLILKFFSAGVDINAVDWQGRTALHIICSHNHMDDDIVKLFILNGANVNARRDNGWTPVLQCSAWANFTTTRILLEHGANVNDCTPDMGTPILHFCSAENYNPQAIRDLIILYKANVRAARADGKTPLHFICEKGDHQIARLLLDFGADINAVTLVEQVTPLHAACFHNHVPVVGILLEYGANANSKLSDGIAPLHVASALGYTDQVLLLCQYGANPNATALNDLTPAFYACDNGYLTTLRALLDNGANVNARCNGQTLLCTAFRKLLSPQDVELLKLLLEVGATVDDPVIQNSNASGTTILQLACWNGGMAPAVVSMLSALQRHHHQQRHPPYAPYGMPNFCTFFLEAGASPSKPNHYGWQALHFAAARGNRSTVHLLLEKEEEEPSTENDFVEKTGQKGRLVNAQTLQGSTPLHIACQLGRWHAVHALLEHGASVTTENCHGKTPLDSAISWGRNHTCIFLILARLAGEGAIPCQKKE